MVSVYDSSRSAVLSHCRLGRALQPSVRPAASAHRDLQVSIIGAMQCEASGVLFANKLGALSSFLWTVNRNLF